MKNIPKRKSGIFSKTQELLQYAYYDDGSHQSDLSELSGIDQGNISKIINEKVWLYI